MERQKQQTEPTFPEASLFRSSTGARISQESIRAVCSGCQHATGGDQCTILSPVSQANNTKSAKCEWKKP